MEQRHPIHIATNSSSNPSIATFQIPPSLGPARSKRSIDSPQPVYANGLGNPPQPQPVANSPAPQRRSHRRSGSVGAEIDGAANLNRWSKSTASSSQSNHQRSTSFSRRMSFGGSGAFNFGIESSPKKLQKARPSTASPSSPSRQPARSSDPSVNPAPILPPILTLPSLQTSVNGNSPLTGSPSTAGLLSAAYRGTTLGEDYFSTETWTRQTRDYSQKRSPSRSRSASVDPSPGLAARSVPSSLHSKAQEEETASRGHSRNRSQAAKSSAGTGSSRNSKQPSQKAMLSKALQKANTAVLLDNAQNFDGAMEAYSEACALLQQVMLRSSGDEDKRKLEAIRNTYTIRINELTKITPQLTNDGKALPARPESDIRGDEMHSPDDEAPAIIEVATVTRIINDQSYVPEYQQSRSIPSSQVPRRRESLLPSALDTAQQYRPRNTGDQYAGRSFSKSPLKERVSEIGVNLAPPMESQYMPPPLSPRRPSSPVNHGHQSINHERQSEADLSSSNLSGTSTAKTHTRAPSNESMSWLDTIDESGGSTASSVHSRTSSMGVRRKHIRAASGATEAEFDAALDAAVEAAYDDGFEPEYPADPTRYDYEDDDEVVLNVRRRVELAKERVRQSEREAAIEEARDRERKRLLQKQQEQQNEIDDGYEGNESEEEERMLEEMTRGFVMDDFEFGLQSKSALPRESDSSGFSGRTWNSSIGSNPTTAGTTLSTVTESSAMPSISMIQQSRTPPPMHPPPALALPRPPNPPSQPPLAIATTQSVRSRRLSGQNAKQLKIETTTKTPSGPLTQPPSMPPSRIPMENVAVQPKTAGFPQQRQPLNGLTIRPPVPQSARQTSSPFPGPGPAEILPPPTPILTQTFTNESDIGQTPASGSPGRTQSRTGLRKNFSSSSLKNMKGRNLSVSHNDDGDDVSPNTPLSSQFMMRENNVRLPAIPALPTPIAVAFKDRMNGAPTGGLYLFDIDIHSPQSPGSPNPMNSDGPIPLEPCPTEFLLRPFWLMRALYQTIAHPRGGYLSAKLFVPRDVWRVKGVKIKNVEDKIANCDFLTAALLKLAQVDTFDADAVLEEMQALEGVLEQVQAILTKKLGNEVGVQGSGGMFKDASFGVDSENSNVAKSGSVSSKSSSFSWRRLRSKNSAVGLSNSYTNKTPVEGPKEGLTMSTLPMTSTSIAKTRFTKRDVSQVQFSGPNANYMGALARLFDAAQAIDQIARQVEDPGLRHADKTQVGLELCTRHAAEFFGFYICRFVLTDIGMLLDKFIKRGSEWVLV